MRETDAKMADSGAEQVPVSILHLGMSGIEVSTNSDGRTHMDTIGRSGKYSRNEPFAPPVAT